MDLNALQTFVAVVRAGGFAAAARQTGTPKSTVSLRIRALESSLGLRLFKRSARSFALTAEGTQLFERSASALESLEAAISGLSTPGESYTGQIRMTFPLDFPAGIISGAISEFREMHPAIRFDVLLSNDVLDLVSQNIDIALRIGAANPQDALVVGVLDLEFGLYASAQYLGRVGHETHGTEIPTLIGPRRLELHRLLVQALPTHLHLPDVSIAVDTFSLVRELVLRHQGVGLLPASLMQSELISGLVERVYPDLLCGSIRMHLTYPSRADLTPKVAAFARVLKRHLSALSSGGVGSEL